jgi:hypothetical protein
VFVIKFINQSEVIMFAEKSAKLPRWLFNREPVGALFEIIFVSVGLFVVLLLAQAALPLTTLTLASKLVLAICTIWFALRLRPREGSLWQQVGYELFVVVVLAATLDNILLAFAVVATENQGFEVTQAREMMVNLLNVFSLTLAFWVYGLARLAVFGYSWLTHAQLPHSRSHYEPPL